MLLPATCIEDLSIYGKFLRISRSLLEIIPAHTTSCIVFPCSISLIILRVSLPICQSFYEHILAPSQSKRMWKGAWRPCHTWRTKKCLVSKSEITAARRIATAFTKQTMKPTSPSVYFASPKLERKVSGNGRLHTNTLGEEMEGT